MNSVFLYRVPRSRALAKSAPCKSGNHTTDTSECNLTRQRRERRPIVENRRIPTGDVRLAHSLDMHYTLMAHLNRLGRVEVLLAAKWPVDEVSVFECPNCGGTDFAQLTQNRRKCAYCGTVLTLRETKPKVVRCPRCGFDNERGDRYCNNCGRPLVSWSPVTKAKRMDPALLSIIVSVVGSLFIFLGGPAVGLVLGYRALREARASGGGDRLERRAKAAVVVGWIVLASTVLPLCLSLLMPGVQWGCSACQGLFEELSIRVLELLSGGSAR
jgi:uncharacterized membrane protein/predicted RNA-binding Zn-ribbon protein involved in translation (DUF1610 family)